MATFLRQGSYGAIFRGTANGQVATWDNDAEDWVASESPVANRTNPVYIEDYLPAAGGSIREATRLALLDNPTARNFIYPVGDFAWIGSFLTDADGLHDDQIFWGYGCHIFQDVGGVATGQIIFFNRAPGTVNIARRMEWRGFHFGLYNALTSFFGAAIFVERASNCAIYDCTFECTLVPAATSGKQRWGSGLFGDSNGPDSGGGRDNFFCNNNLIGSQHQGCGAGRSCRNITCSDNTATRSNDYAISVVSIKNPALPLVAQKMENVTIDGLNVFDNLGSGAILAGGDGGTAGEGVGEIRNFTISNVQLSGSRVDDLDFVFIAAIVFFGGVITENINFHDINTKLSSNTSQAASLNIGSSADQVAGSDWVGLNITSCNLGIVSAVDNYHQIIFDGIGADSVVIADLTLRGTRGLKLVNCDFVSIEGVVAPAGNIELVCDRNITSILISNCTLTKSANFLPSIWVRSTTINKNVASCIIDGCYLNSQVEVIRTELFGGTMAMQVCNCIGRNTTAASAETIAGIIKASNNIQIPGTTSLVSSTTVLVSVPNVAAGQVGYAIVNMVGSRLAGILANTPIVVNPQVQLLAAGAGGGAGLPRVSALNTVEIPFIGPMTAQNVNFTFWTP